VRVFAIFEDLLGRPVWTDSTTHTERLEVLHALAASGPLQSKGSESEYPRCSGST